MSKFIVIRGKRGVGKSTYAENLSKKYSKVCFMEERYLDWQNSFLNLNTFYPNLMVIDELPKNFDFAAFHEKVKNGITVQVKTQEPYHMTCHWILITQHKTPNIDKSKFEVIHLKKSRQ